MAVQMLLHIEPESQLWPRDKKRETRGGEGEEREGRQWVDGSRKEEVG